MCTHFYNYAVCRCALTSMWTYQKFYELCGFPLDLATQCHFTPHHTWQAKIIALYTQHTDLYLCTFKSISLHSPCRTRKSQLDLFTQILAWVWTASESISWYLIFLNKRRIDHEGKNVFLICFVCRALGLDGRFFFFDGSSFAFCYRRPGIVAP